MEIFSKDPTNICSNPINDFFKNILAQIMYKQLVTEIIDGLKYY